MHSTESACGHSKQQLTLAVCWMSGKSLATEEAAREDTDVANVGDEEWEVVAKSHNAARRKKRKQARWANQAAAAAQRAAQADHTKEEAHHLEGTADGGDYEDWKTDGRA